MKTDAFTVQFTPGARKDLRSIRTYISKNDSPENADYVARGIVRTALSLQELATRGAYPPELLQVGDRSFRQVLFKPYRIIYRIRGNAVYIALIADGRRDLASVLARRLHES